MRKDARIFVAGHQGLAGSAIMEHLQELGYQNLITYARHELDLCDIGAVEKFFAHEKPEYIFLAAAKVGGIHANYHYPAEFIHSNLTIQTNVIHQSWKHHVKRLLFLGSSCVYPKQVPQPMKEQYLLTGPLEHTNRPYAIAKIAGIEMCGSYNRQYETRYLAVMPTNLYGLGDNYHPDNSHVIPGLIRKFYMAKERGDPHVEVWGTGKPRREFMHKKDLARGCIFLMNLPDDRFSPLTQPHEEDGDMTFPLINIGTGQDISIAELATTIAEITGFEGEIRYNTNKPDGTIQKLLDISKMQALGWKPEISLREGLQQTIDNFSEETRL